MYPVATWSSCWAGSQCHRRRLAYTKVICSGLVRERWRSAVDVIRFLGAGAILALGVSASLPMRAAGSRRCAAARDDEYWRIVSEFSERAGTFQSDNLLSNERWLQHVIPDLVANVANVAKAGQSRVYVGVGPEQNFTYIAALQPAHGVHRGHPPRKLRSAPDVQGALRALGRSRRVRLAAVLPAAAARADREVDGRGNLRGLRKSRVERHVVQPEHARHREPPDQDARVPALVGRHPEAPAHLQRDLRVRPRHPGPRPRRPPAAG